MDINSHLRNKEIPVQPTTMQLSDVEVRILGCLIEKEATTPDN